MFATGGYFAEPILLGGLVYRDLVVLLHLADLVEDWGLFRRPDEGGDFRRHDGLDLCGGESFA
jgi:hypothetical protein